MALASYGEPRFLPHLRERVCATGDGGFAVHPVDWATLAKARPAGEDLGAEHADLAASVQARLEEVLLDLARGCTRGRAAAGSTMAGGVALNCVANARLAAEGPFERVWVQPAAGDAGTALGAALHVAREPGPAHHAHARARTWVAGSPTRRSRADSGGLRCPTSAPVRPRGRRRRTVLADDGIVAWFQGRSEYGPRALGHRSLLAHPGDPQPPAAERREGARAVPAGGADGPPERAADVFDGVGCPARTCSSSTRYARQWRDRIPAVVHVDGTPGYRPCRR